MYLKLFPSYNDSRSNVFNESEVRRISSLFTSWRFPRTDFFGPYELLNFTLLGPYENSKFLNSTCYNFLSCKRMHNKFLIT